MGDIVDSVARVLESNRYFRALVVIVVILVVVMWVFSLVTWAVSKKERYLGDGTVQTNTPFTSGATMRVLSQLPTATNQDSREWVSNAEIKELIPGVVSGKKERLVSNRAEPNFFEIGDELSAYQSGEGAAGLASDASSDPSGAGPQTERYSSSPMSQVETIELAQMLGTYPRTSRAY